jgi:AraC-like DNA-binding protein
VNRLPNACSVTTGAVSAVAPLPSSSLADLPPVFTRGHLAEDRDPQALATQLTQHFPFTDFAARTVRDQPFLHRTATVPVGGLPVSGGYTCSVQGQVADHAGLGAINFVRSGSIRYEFEGKPLLVDASTPLLFSGGQEYAYSVDQYTGVAFNVDLQRLCSTAQAMAGLGGPGRLGLADLQRPQVVDRHSQRRRSLIRTLWRVFELLDHDLAQDPLLLQHLQIEDLLYRSMALLLLPRLDQGLQAAADSAIPARQRILQELMEWIDANLQRSITLTELEQRSGYSRRSLQMAFQQRYGCGPIQWIRLRRLEQARQALLRPLPTDTVSTIARRYGYRHPASFSRDISRVFGLTPSELLRMGRSDLPI